MNREKLMTIYQKYQWLLKAGLMALLPLLCCLVACRTQGYSLGQVYLPSCEWNDELFYYKQVEGILSHGYPQGYFGFNESHALKLSFAAWSPVLVFPWILWGLVFGWNLMSPVYCNIVLMMLAIFFYVLLVKPDRKQLGILTILFSLFTPFTRYMLSVMPEVICFSILIIFYALAVSYLEHGKTTWKLVLLFVLACLMTLMRPYLILFLLLPAFLWLREDRSIKSAAGSIVILCGTLGLYAAINHFLGAEYFTPLFKTQWLSVFWEEGFFAGCKNVLVTLWYTGKDFAARTIEGFRSGLAEGAFFAGFLAILFTLLWQTGAAVRRKKTSRIILYGHLAFSYASMLAAVLLMYKLKEGSKHLLTFIAVGIFVVSLMETRFFKKAMFLGVLFGFLYTVQANSPVDYQIPFAEEERLEEMAYWEQTLQNMSLESEDTPNYENVVIWVFSDDVSGEAAGEDATVQTSLQTSPVQTRWQALYALPEGFGISCCYREYVIENFDTLKSRYLITVSDGVIDRMCREAGFTELGRYGETVFYDRGEATESE